MLAGFSRERPMVRAAETALIAKGGKAGGMKGLKANASDDAQAEIIVDDQEADDSVDR